MTFEKHRLPRTLFSLNLFWILALVVGMVHPMTILARNRQVMAPAPAASVRAKTRSITAEMPSQLPVECSSGISSDVTTDTTWSGDVYIAAAIDVNSGATLSITPGSNVFFCGEYRLKIGTLFTAGRLVARGTPDQPIAFQSADGGVVWNGLVFENNLESDPSIVQFAEFSGGGGSDPTNGHTIQVISRAAVPDFHTPLIDNVTIDESSGYGIDLETDAANDPTPPLVTNVTISNTTLAPIIADAAAVTGLGTGLALISNTPNRIAVRGGQLGFDQRWRDHGVPYEILDHVYARSSYPDGEVRPAVWTIDSGVVLLIHPDKDLSVGSLSSEGALKALGTSTNPITFTRLSDTSAPWGSLHLNVNNDFDSELRHVRLIYGGGPAATGSQSVILKRSDGELRLDGVTVQHSFNGALRGNAGSLWIRDSAMNFNRFGVSFSGPDAQVRSSDLSGNDEFAFVNTSSGYYCYDAIGNYWGPGGPSDASSAEDACGSTVTNSGSGVTSDGILYEPWRSADDGFASFGSIRPDVHWVIADGVDSAELTVTLRDAQGAPLAGKEVELETNVGTLAQPAAPTDGNGETTATITSAEVGFATITAYNVTDDEPVSGLSGVNFWQGGGDFGGLIDPDGAPYASPTLLVQGQPFQQGFPVDMRVPMRNSQSSPIDVQVVYGVSDLGVGLRFTPVYTANKTLQPGESWDAMGVWLPTVGGHHCIQATVKTGAGRLTIGADNDDLQKNTEENPCGDLPTNVGDYAPSAPSFNSGNNTLKLAKHYKKQAANLQKANDCIAEEVNFRRFGFDADTRDYETIVTVPTFTPPPIQPDVDVTQDQADALNALSQTSADLLGLNLAMGVTRQRMNWAAQADALADLDRQYAAFLGFMDEYIQKLRTLADQHDDLLAVTEGAGMNDGFYYPEDFETAYDELAQQGFDTETESYMLQSGLDQPLIEEIRQDILARRETQTFATTSFYEMVRETRDEARTLADRLEAQYGGLQTRRTLTAGGGLLNTEPQTYEFQVGHGAPVTETVELVARPVNLPVDWSYRLEEQSLTLGPGEVTTTTLTLTPGATVPEASTVEVAVEGYVDDALVGGVLFTYNAPVISGARFGGTIFLPAVLRR